eukprot:jgi/Mesvir1/17685/Mv07865-RA.1
MAAQEEDVEELFTKLNDCVQSRDYDEVVEAADRIIRVLPQDSDAHTCKVVALLQLGQIPAALDAIKAAGPGLSDALRVHEAYARYRSGAHAAALDLLRAIPPSELARHPGAAPLRAQILYRSGDYAGCIRVYEDEFQRLSDSLEIKTNVLAAYVAGGRSHEVPAVMQAMKAQPSDSFEMAFNAACAAIERGELASAEAMLLAGQRVGREALIEDDATEEEVESELAALVVQLHYVRQLMGRSTEALAGYVDILKAKPDDPVALAVAACNLVALRGAREMFDGLKRMDRLIDKAGGKLSLTPALEGRLSQRQRDAILLNRCLLLLRSGKMDACREVLAAMQGELASATAQGGGGAGGGSNVGAAATRDLLVLLEAAVLLHEKKGEEADRLLAAHAQRSPDASDLLHLTRAEMAAAQKDATRALASLAQLSPALRHCPAVLATRCALLDRAGNGDAALEELQATIEFYDRQAAESGSPVLAPQLRLWKEAAATYQSHGRFDKAVALFERLLQASSAPSRGGDAATDADLRSEAVLGLVMSAIHADAEAAEKYSKFLPPLPNAASVNVDALERTAAIPAPATAAAAGGAASGKDAGKKPEGGAAGEGKGKEVVGGADAGGKGGKGAAGAGQDNKGKRAAKKAGNEDADRPKKKRKRKKIYPKGFDPANPGPPPDPERWLPKSERSTYKKSKGKKAQHHHAVRGSQGAVPAASGGDVEMTPAATGGQSKAAATTPPPPAMSAPPGAKPGKKGKGKR